MSSTVRLTSAPAATGPPELSVAVDVHVNQGGRIGQIWIGDIPLLIDIPEAIEAPGSNNATQSVKWGSYPMAPWAGRVRSGRFTYFDTEHQLRLNQDDSGIGAEGRQHAMHGTVLGAAWVIEDQHAASIEMSCPLDQPDSGWPFGGIAQQRIEIREHQLRCDLSVHVEPGHVPRPAGGQSPPDAPVSFPAVVGWHPWWRKPDALTFHPDAQYERDDVGLPTGRLVPPTTGPWDDCFVNTAPVTLHYDRDSVRNVTVNSDCDHWVIYDMPEHATCVEPQSGPPDAFNLRPHIVTAANPLRRTMIVRW